MQVKILINNKSKTISKWLKHLILPNKMKNKIKNKAKRRKKEYLLIKSYKKEEIVMKIDNLIKFYKILRWRINPNRRFKNNSLKKILSLMIILVWKLNKIKILTMWNKPGLKKEEKAKIVKRVKMINTLNKLYKSLKKNKCLMISNLQKKSTIRIRNLRKKIEKVKKVKKTNILSKLYKSL